ncbi:MAG: mechanosensitive ion channel [Candidatus Cloacimonetes bacterium]|nr:mechanosensitive ion channel [Candidatus Cloacimonadota bacterium]
MDWLFKLLPQINSVLLYKVISSVFIILMLSLLKWIIVRMLEKHSTDNASLFNTRKTIHYVLVIVGIVIVGRIWFEGFQSIATYLGLVSAGLAIALKDVFTNLAGWLFIISRKPFVTGNRIQIGEQCGDVIDIRPFEFTILEIGNWVKADQSTGRMIHIPNCLVFTNSVANYDVGFQYIWNEIPVQITFESDWQKAKQILTDIINEHSLNTTAKAEKQIIQAAKKFLIFYKTITPIVYTSVLDSGVVLTIRYLTEIRKRRGSTEEIWENILLRFAEHDDIDLAYPTIRRVD